MNRAQVGVFKQASQVRFGRFLQRQDSVRLESQVSLEVLGDFSDQALKRQLADQEFCRFLVFSVFFVMNERLEEDGQKKRKKERGRDERRREKSREKSELGHAPASGNARFFRYI